MRPAVAKAASVTLVSRCEGPNTGSFHPTRNREETPAMAKKRTALSKRTRFEIFKRDDFTCGYCGSTPPKVVLHVDHVVPICDGGTNEEENLFTSCEVCNLGKGPVPLGEKHPPRAEDATESLLEKAEQLSAYQESMEAWIEARRDWETHVATILHTALFGPSEPQLMLSGKRSKWVLFYVDALGYQTTVEMAEVAFRRDLWSEDKTWRYFCGCCQNRIKEAAE